MKITSWILALSVTPLLVAQTPFSQTQYAKDVLALSPLGFWPLHGDANDLSPHSNNGTAMNNVNFASFVGPLGTSASPAAFFYNGQIISIPQSAVNLGALHALTAMAWIRTQNVTLSSSLILGKIDSQVGAGWAIGIDNGELGAPPKSARFALLFFSAGKPLLIVESNVGVADGGWHLVSATYDGSGTANGVRLYIDGLKVATTTVVNSIGNGSILTNHPVTIGNTDDGQSSFDGSINDAAIFDTALTPEQNLQLILDAPGYRRVLGQFAFGGGWYSAVYFQNAGANSVSFPVSFAGDDGKPLTVPSVGVSSTTVTLAPGASAVIEAPNQGDLVQGYVSLVLPVGVNAYGVFRQSVPGVADQEAVVPLSPAGTRLQGLLFDETNFITGVAIVNPSSVDTTVTINVLDDTGAMLGSASVMLAAGAKTEGALRSFAGLEGIAGKRGTAIFTTPPQTTMTPTGNVAVLGLRFNGLAFTSIPAFGAAGI
jgi:Concanavalin A-like lectin/glucanases superfamily